MADDETDLTGMSQIFDHMQYRFDLGHGCTFGLDLFNEVSFGVFDASPLKNSKSAEDGGVRTLASVGRGMPTLKANYKDVGVFENMTTAESFASVVLAHETRRHKPYEAYVEDEAYKSGDIIIHALYVANSPDKMKRAENATAGVAKRGYVHMSYDLRHLNSDWRTAQKGFELYAIGTGETMQAIRGRLKKRV